MEPYGVICRVLDEEPAMVMQFRSRPDETVAVVAERALHKLRTEFFDEDTSRATVRSAARRELLRLAAMPRPSESEALSAALRVVLEIPDVVPHVGVAQLLVRPMSDHIDGDVSDDQFNAFEDVADALGVLAYATRRARLVLGLGELDAMLGEIQRARDSTTIERARAILRRDAPVTPAQSPVGPAAEHRRYLDLGDDPGSGSR